jgi:hypothetical protein
MLTSVTVPPEKMPASLTRTSSRPNFSIVKSTSAFICACTETSVCLHSVRSAGRLRATFSSFSRVRPANTTFARSPEKRLAAASPMPEPAPVTITTLLSKRCITASVQYQEFE